METLHAIVLGITQGLAEFLPISSSGHLELVPWLFGWNDFEGNPSLDKAFDVALHIGTFAGAVAYFRRDLWRLLMGGLFVLPVDLGIRELPTTVDNGGGDLGTPPDPLADRVTAGRIAWLLVVSAVPAGVTGLALESLIENQAGSIPLVAVMLIVFGLVLLWADRLGGDRTAGSFSLRDALAMGIGQALALQPGVSRSGVTITVSRKLGFDRDAAARLSFLMSLPVIAGAGLVKAADVVSEGGIPADARSAFAAGMASAAVTGWFAVWGTLRFIKTRTFTPFVIYRVAAGSAVLTAVAVGLR